MKERDQCFVLATEEGAPENASGDVNKMVKNVTPLIQIAIALRNLAILMLSIRRGLGHHREVAQFPSFPSQRSGYACFFLASLF
jgi:hypothetical protein|mmetsp:Transcript_22910/g.36631  ORF Transcript_22910/g.36631 Transcript_22910/m.36631 type:complete len:84 (+) Transcript_22910:137-388(+)